MNAPTQAQVKEAAKARGVVARWSAEWSEWRVAFPLDHYTAQGMTRARALEAQEAQACYCTDPQEAIDNANAMANALRDSRMAPRMIGARMRLATIHGKSHVATSAVVEAGGYILHVSFPASGPLGALWAMEARGVDVSPYREAQARGYSQ